MPDLAFLRVKIGKGPQKDLVYTIIRNKAHSNVAFIFGEDKRRRSKEDTLTIIRGFVGSYPNFFFQAKFEDMERFATKLRRIKNRKDFTRFVTRYGMRRTDPEFWKLSDWFIDRFYHISPGEAGLFDLNRYRNH